MRRLPYLFFAAAIAIWGLASIPDGSGDEKSLRISRIQTAAAHRYGQSVTIPRDALARGTATPSSLRVVVVGLGPE